VRHATILFCAAFLLIAPAPRAEAEIFVLKSGGRIEGQPLASSRERGQPVVLKTEDGVRLALPDSTVERVIVKSDFDKQYEALVPKLKQTVEDQWEMAEWCKDAGLSDERQRHLRAVIEIEPNHEEARKALGYRRIGSRWLTQEEHMLQQGYVRYKGAWRLRQEIEIESRETQQELAIKKFRKDLRMWLEQAASGGRHADTAERNLKAINDPAAATPLAEIVGDASQPRKARLRCLAILSQVAPEAATATLVRVAMEDADEGLREACLEVLAQLGPQESLADFIKELKHKDNARINRAAECIQRIGGQEATLALINALVTEHRVQVQQGPPPGSMTTTFSPNGSPGAGGLAMGGKTQIVKQQRKNGDVLAALASFYPDVNFQYDVEAWRQWYIKSRTTTDIDLRRDE
jgi:hypothetical protein